MLTAPDLNTVVLPSEERSRTASSALMFNRRTIWTVYITANAITVALVFWGMTDRTALLTPVSPDLRAFMIGFGVFIGVLVAVVDRDAWLIGAGGWRAPKGMWVGVSMAVLVAASGFGGDFLATRIWEWRAFHGLHPATADRTFTIVSRYSGRSGKSLTLQDQPATRPPVSINCSYEMYKAVQDGDRLIIPVETGRGGVQRMTLPALKDLRRG